MVNYCEFVRAIMLQAKIVFQRGEEGPGNRLAKSAAEMGKDWPARPEPGYANLHWKYRLLSL